MVRIRGETLIGRPVEQVFDFIADERNEPRYNPMMARVELLTEGPVSRGTRFRATMRSKRRSYTMETEIIDIERPVRVLSATDMGTAEVYGGLTFEAERGGTRMRWSWELKPLGVLRIAGPLIGWIGRRTEASIWAAAKRYLEAAASVPPTPPTPTPPTPPASAPPPSSSSSPPTSPPDE